MKPILQFLSLFLFPAAIGILLSPFFARLDKYGKARRDAADREAFNRRHPQEPQ